MEDNSYLPARLTIAFIVSLLVTTVALFSIPKLNSSIVTPQDSTRADIKTLNEAIKIFYTQEHRWPDSLGEIPLQMWEDAGYYRDSKNGFIDSWNRPYHYSLKEKSYLLVSYGADGKPGGTGQDFDLTNHNLNSPEAQPSWQQIYLRPTSTMMIFAALFSGAVTFGVTFNSLKPTDIEKSRPITLILRLFVTFIAASYVACIITAWDAPTGH